MWLTPGQISAIEIRQKKEEQTVLWGRSSAPGERGAVYYLKGPSRLVPLPLPPMGPEPLHGTQGSRKNSWQQWYKGMASQCFNLTYNEIYFTAWMETYKDICFTKPVLHLYICCIVMLSIPSFEKLTSFY